MNYGRLIVIGVVAAALAAGGIVMSCGGCGASPQTVQTVRHDAVAVLGCIPAADAQLTRCEVAGGCKLAALTQLVLCVLSTPPPAVVPAPPTAPPTAPDAGGAP